MLPIFQFSAGKFHMQPLNIQVNGLPLYSMGIPVYYLVAKIRDRAVNIVAELPAAS